jgi:hypothetical protein
LCGSFQAIDPAAIEPNRLALRRMGTTAGRGLRKGRHSMRILITLGIATVLVVAAFTTWGAATSGSQVQPASARIDILQLHQTTYVNGLPEWRYDAI